MGSDCISSSSFYLIQLQCTCRPSINRSINQSISQSVNQSINQSINRCSPKITLNDLQLDEHVEG